MNEYSIIMIRESHSTLKDCMLFLSNFSIPYSIKIHYIILNSIKSLKYFPNINPIFKKTSKNLYRKLIVINRYLVIYTVKQNTVLSYYILDGRRHLDNYFNLLK